MTCCPDPWGYPAPLVVLTWAVASGTALALAGETGIAVYGSRPRPAEGTGVLPNEVHERLTSDRHAIRAALEQAHVALAHRGYVGWPAVQPWHLTIAAWAAAVRAGFDEDSAALFDERAAVYEMDGCMPGWMADSLAVEDIVRERLVALKASEAIAGQQRDEELREIDTDRTFGITMDAAAGITEELAT